MQTAPKTTPSDSFPRALVILNNPFNRQEAGGILLANAFGGWPRSALAQIYGPSAYVRPDHDLCQNYYLLNFHELRRPWLVWALRDRRRVQPPDGVWQAATTPTDAPATGLRARLRQGLLHLLEQWNLQFNVTAHLSPKLKAWLDDYRPEVIFATPVELGFVRLAQAVADYTGAPLVLQLYDNWVDHHYLHGPYAWLARPQLESALGQLCRQAAARFVISPEMAAAYQQRFGAEFAVMSGSVATQDWANPQPVRHEPDPATGYLLAFSGTIFSHNQLDALMMVAEAAAQLTREGLPCRLEIRTPAMSIAHYGERLRALGVTVAQAAGRKDELALLHRAHLLLIPVNFDEESGRFIKYSLPFKTSAYLATGTPVMVIAPADYPPARHLREHDCGFVHSTPTVSSLAAALRPALTDRLAREHFSQIALRVAHDLHERDQVTADFQQTLRQLARPRAH